MRIRRLAGVVAAAALLVGSMGTAAVAAPPPNDDVGTPTAVTVPSTFFQDTTDATVALTDPSTSCVGPVGATVWYSFTTTSDGYVQFNTFGSTDYDSVIAVYVDEAIQANEVACNDDAGGSLQSRVNVEVTSGTTYLIMVGSLGGQGGSLQFNSEVGNPPIELTLIVDPRGSVTPKTGMATLRGTVTCSEPTTVGIEAWLRQRSGRLYIFGSGFTELECDGSARFELPMMGDNGLFVGGKADAQVVAYSFDDLDAYAFAEQTVRLSGVRTGRR